MTDDQRATGDKSSPADDLSDDDDLGGPLGQIPVSPERPPTSPTAPQPLPRRFRTDVDAPAGEAHPHT